MVERRLRTATAAALACLALATGAARAEHDDNVAREPTQLSTWASVAKRNGLQLQLRAANGQVIRFDSQHPPDKAQEQHADYRFAGVTRDGKFFVVHAKFYESETCYWISRATGQKQEVFAAPDVSPDGHYAVTALHWESFGPGGLFVWEIAGNQLAQRGRIGQGEYGLFTFLRWTGNDTADLERYSLADPKLCPKSQSMTATVHLARSRGQWTLAGPTGASDVHCE